MGDVTYPDWLAALVAGHRAGRFTSVLRWEDPDEAPVLGRHPAEVTDRPHRGHAMDLRRHPRRWALIAVAPDLEQDRNRIQQGREEWHYLGNWEARRRKVRHPGGERLDELYVRYLGVEQGDDFYGGVAP